MSKLVILNQGMTGRTFELNTERTTVGRVEDNAFQITDGSVSSHHAEIILRGSDIVIRDLNSTNGTFINNEMVTERVLQPGQTLKFGQVELKIDDGKPVTAPPPAPVVPGASAPVPAPSPTPGKRTAEGTLVIARGVSLEQLEQGGTRTTGFDTKGTGFSKKSNKINTYFIIGGIVVFVIIVVLILLAVKSAGGHQ
ncbi:MAG: FHA domain-containing protein [Verrucomicrobiota bacterium]|jgi:pSer/pThr/pTyr-binding forkhead associated (FHA) protein